MTGRTRNRRGFRSRKAGASIAEFAAAMILLLPVIITVCFVAAEAAQVYMIKSGLNYCATVAARRLSIAYGLNPTGTVGNEDAVFDTVRHTGIVISSQQFDVPPGSAGWNTAGQPPTVSVEVRFQGGQYGLPAFPNPDPLGLGQGMVLQSVATARLE